MSKERSNTVFWYDGDKLIPIYEGEFHGYFLFFHPEELGISKEEVESVAIEYGYSSLQEAYDELKDPDSMEEYNWLWKELMELAIGKHHLLRVGSYSGSRYREVYFSCKSIERDAGKVMDCLLENKDKLHCSESCFYAVEELQHEITARKDTGNIAGKCIEATGISNFLEQLCNINY